MILYDFYCKRCHHKYEALAKIKDTIGQCPKCEGPTTRVLSTPAIMLDGTDPAFSTAYDKWAKRHEDATKRAYQRDDREGLFHGDN